MYINKAFIYGNLTRDPELRSLPSGSQVVSFSIATNRTWKDQSGAKQEASEFHNIVAFGRQAELVSQYLKKGNTAFIEGRIQTRSWDADGQKKYRTEIVADSIQFGPKGGAMGGPVGDSRKNDSSDNQDSGGGIEYPQEDINPDDIPF